MNTALSGHKDSHVVDILSERFHDLYERSKRDGTLRMDISATSLFSSTFHIMLAAVTRYAVGLVYVSEEADPEAELIMLEDLLISRYVQGPRPDVNPPTI